MNSLTLYAHLSMTFQSKTIAVQGDPHKNAGTIIQHEKLEYNSIHKTIII